MEPRRTAAAPRRCPTLGRGERTDPHDAALPVEHTRDLAASPAVLGPWLIEAAARLADTLRGTGPDTTVWTPVPGATAEFCARRFAHETAVHRADATLAIGAEFRLGQDVALDAIDEWMELGSLPMHFEVHPWMRELLDPGRTLHFHATDMAPQAAAEWLIDLTGGAIAWRRAHEKAAVAVRGPLTDLPLWPAGTDALAHPEDYGTPIMSLARRCWGVMAATWLGVNVGGKKSLGLT